MVYEFGEQIKERCTWFVLMPRTRTLSELLKIHERSCLLFHSCCTWCVFPLLRVWVLITAPLCHRCHLPSQARLFQAGRS